MNPPNDIIGIFIIFEDIHLIQTISLVFSMILVGQTGFKSSTQGTGYAPIVDRCKFGVTWVAGPYKFPNVNGFTGVTSPRNKWSYVGPHLELVTGPIL